MCCETIKGIQHGDQNVRYAYVQWGCILEEDDEGCCYLTQRFLHSYISNCGCAQQTGASGDNDRGGLGNQRLLSLIAEG